MIQSRLINRNSSLINVNVRSLPKRIADLRELELAGEKEPAADSQLEELRAELAALKSNFTGRANIECWNCHKSGHISFNCPTEFLSQGIR